jgi:hypothetical protein
MKNKALHDTLSQVKYRMLILLPPALIVIAELITVFIQIYTHFSFKIPTFIGVTYFIGSIWIIIGAGIITWSDIKRISCRN